MYMESNEQYLFFFSLDKQHKCITTSSNYVKIGNREDNVDFRVTTITNNLIFLSSRLCILTLLLGGSPKAVILFCVIFSVC